MTNRCILNIYLSNGKGFCAFPSSSLTTIDELITFLEREYERYYPSDDSIKIKNIQYLDLTDKENPVKYEILSDWESLDINQNNKTNNKMLEYLFGKNAFLYLEVDKYNTGTTFDIVSPVPGSMRTRKIVEIDQPLLSFDSDTVQSNNDSIIFVDEDGEDSIFEKALKEHEEGRQHDVMQEEERTEVFPSPEVEQPKEEEKQIEEKQETKEDIVNNENLEQQKEEDEVMKEQQLEQQKQPKEEKQDTEVPINRNSTTSVNTNVVTEQLSEDEITIVIDDEETTEDEKEEEPKNQQGITTIASSNQTTQTKPPSPIMDEVMSEHEEDNNNTESSKLLLAPVSQLFTQPISSSPLNKVKSPTSSISSSLESSIPQRTEDEPLVISQKAKEKLLGLSQETKRKGVDTATPPKKITFPKTPQPTSSSSSQNSENSPTAKSTSKVTKQKKMYSELGKAPIAKKLQWIKQAVQKVKPNNDTKK